MSGGYLVQNGYPVYGTKTSVYDRTRIKYLGQHLMCVSGQLRYKVCHETFASSAASGREWSSIFEALWIALRCDAAVRARVL